MVRETDVDWNQLAGRICGTITLRSDRNYTTALNDLVWNALKPDRYPAAIAHVRNEGDIRECVLFARANGLKLIVRGGGHNWNGAQVRDGRLVIDISAMTDVHIDAERRRAIIQPIVTNEQNVAALKKKGLAFPVGDCPPVSASGYLLGGGLGLNTPNWGTGCQNVEAVHCITATGESVVADADHNTELFWAARGGAQGFPGVVTRYRLTPHPYPQAIRQSVLIYRLREAQQFADWLSERMMDFPPALHSNTLLTSTLFAKGLEDLSNRMLPSWLRRALERIFRDEDPGQGWLTYVGAAFADTEDEAKELLAPFQKVPPGPKPVFHQKMMPSSFRFLNDFTGALFPEGRRYFVDYHWVDITLGDVVRRVSAEYERRREADSFILVASYQTPPAQMLPPDTAAFTMSSHNLVGIYGIGDDPGDDPFNSQWVANVREILEPNSLGLYVGEADLSIPGRARKCYSPEGWAKLSAIKKKYDPDDLFAWFLGEESPSAGGK